MYLFSEITEFLHVVVNFAGLQVGFKSEVFSALFVCTGEGMELLLARVGAKTIRTIRRWCRDAMMLYLKTSAQILTASRLARMVQHGNIYSYHPPMGDSTPVLQVWASPRPYLGRGGCTGIVSVCP